MMVSRLSKLPWIVSVAVFIFISVSSAEKTRCFWCGPLAEQVHRSQRAPSCDVFHLEQHETVCDQGYTHCAIIAAAPPYAVSRLCVKFYQDECYSLYCNSTKTWRVVCACRGDLCNGPHTARETQAFALLPKFTKTKPHKRNLVSNFISLKTKTPSDDDTVIIIGKENETIHSILSDQPNENTNLYTPTPKHEEENLIIVHGTLKNVEKSIHASTNKAGSNVEGTIHSEDHTFPAAVDNDPDDSKPDEPIGKVENVEVGTQVNNTEEQHPDNIEKEKNLDDSEVGEHVQHSEGAEHLHNSDADNNPDNIEAEKRLHNPEEAKVLDTAEEDKPANEEISKPTEAAYINESLDSAVTSMKPTAVQSSATLGILPPAEALQQNVTPSKAGMKMEVTTTENKAMSTENHITESTLPTEVNNTKKSSGSQNFAHLIIFTISSFVHYCI